MEKEITINVPGLQIATDCGQINDCHNCALRFNQCMWSDGSRGGIGCNNRDVKKTELAITMDNFLYYGGKCKDKLEICPKGSDATKTPIGWNKI